MFQFMLCLCLCLCQSVFYFKKQNIAKKYVLAIEIIKCKSCSKDNMLTMAPEGQSSNLMVKDKGPMSFKTIKINCTCKLLKGYTKVFSYIQKFAHNVSRFSVSSRDSKSFLRSQSLTRARRFFWDFFGHFSVFRRVFIRQSCHGM